MTNDALLQPLVLGGTGIVGGYIVAQIVGNGGRPVVLSRSPRNAAGIDWIVGDLTAPQQLALPPFEVLFCTIEIDRLADALPVIAPPTLKRVIAFSSTSVLTKIESEIGEERELLRRLASGEARLRAFCEERGIGWTILRPTLIYAEGRDGNVSRLARLIGRIGFVPMYGQATGLRQPVHAEDLAKGAIAAAASPQAINKTYALPGGETLSYRDMVGRIFDALHRPRRMIALPPWLWRVAFMLAKPFFPKANVAMGSRMAKDMVFDDAPARQDFGWTARPFRPQFDRATPADHLA